MTGGWKAASIGALLAVIVVVVALGVLIVVRDVPAESTGSMLIIATAPSDTQGEVVASVLRIDTSTGSAKPLDVLATTAISGTSATNASEAYAFGGGALVARAVQGQVAGAELPWIVVTADAWRPILDDVGGVTVDLPTGVNVYAESTLTVLPQGPTTLDGEQLSALIRSTEYLGAADRKAVQEAMDTAFIEAFKDSGTDFMSMVGERGVKASSSAGSVKSLVVR